MQRLNDNGMRMLTSTVEQGHLDCNGIDRRTVDSLVRRRLVTVERIDVNMIRIRAIVPTVWGRDFWELGQAPKRLTSASVARLTGCSVSRNGNSKCGWIDIDAPDGMLSKELLLPGNTYHYTSDDYSGGHSEALWDYQGALSLALEDFAELVGEF